MKKIEIPGFKLIGLKLNHKTKNADGQSAIDCGTLWQKFINENYIENIPNKLSHEIYAVYFDYDGDYTQLYSYFIGCKVESDTDAPNGMNILNIPDDKYNIVIANGRIPECIGETWKEIWESDLNRAYHFDFEVYGESSKDWENAVVDICLSIK